MTVALWLACVKNKARMRQHIRHLPVVIASLMLAACGSSGNKFKVSGRLLQMNQGEFYVYSDDESVDGIDTIKVQGGRFEYELPCERATTLTIVFPNFSEQPLFAEPGKTAKVEGDASHLKTMEVKGTADNELMTAFRAQAANASPPETAKLVGDFVAKNPKSPVGVWLVRKYLVATATPNYKEAERLMKLMVAAQKDNAQLSRLSQSIGQLKASAVGSALPSFTVTDTNGKTVSSSQFTTGTAVICTFASWSYNSTDVMRRLQEARKSDSSLKVLAISLDAQRRDCDNFVTMNQISFPVVCTGEMFDTKPLAQLGLKAVPCNIVVKDGRIVARSLSAKDLLEKIK